VTDDRPVASGPPIPLEKLRHDSIAASAMPHQQPARAKHACKLMDDPRVIGRIKKESERGEEIDDGVEPAGPCGRQATHVGARVFQIGAGSASGRQGEKITRQVDPVNVIASLGEEMCVPPLTAGDVENSGANRQAHDVDEPRDLAAVFLERKERLVLEQVLLVEVRRPPGQPVFLSTQKNTGSR